MCAGSPFSGQRPGSDVPVLRLLDPVTASTTSNRKPKKGHGGKGKWTWETKTEGKPNHYLDTLVGASAIADMKNYRALASREVLFARRSQVQQQRANPPAAAGGIKTPDRRSFFANRR